MECTLYLTENCNLRCSYCYEGNNKQSNSLTPDKLSQTLKFIVENNPPGETIDMTFLGGEPLLNKNRLYDFFHIIEEKYSESKYIFKYHITTNGILLDESLIALLKKYNFAVSISIDGDKKTHNLNRKSISGKDVYDIIIDNMHLMKKLNLDFSVRMTVTQNNVAFLYTNILYFYNMGINKINIGVDCVGDWSNEALQVLDMQYDLLDMFYLDMIADSEDGVINLYDFKFSTFVAAKTPTYCSGGSKGHLVINSKGELYPCGYVVNDEMWNLGSVDTHLDRKKFFLSVRANVENRSLCHECDIAFTCSGAKCGFYNYMKTGKLNVNTGMTCKLERMLYNHNLHVIKLLYGKRHKRLLYYLKKAADNKIEISQIMLEIMDSVE